MTEVYKRDTSTKTVNSPILHDIIKSELTHNYNLVFQLCKELPSVKNSNLFKKTYWQLKEARQEQQNKRYYQADCVWFFDGQKADNYYVVHEVKTGYYEVLDIYNKYRTGSSGQIWIWGWKLVNDSKVFGESYQRKIKLIDIESIFPLIKHDINKILEGVGG